MLKNKFNDKTAQSIQQLSGNMDFFDLKCRSLFYIKLKIRGCNWIDGLMKVHSFEDDQVIKTVEKLPQNRSYDRVNVKTEGDFSKGGLLRSRYLKNIERGEDLVE